MIGYFLLSGDTRARRLALLAGTYPPPLPSQCWRLISPAPCPHPSRSYHLFRYPILFILLFVIYAEFSFYVLIRQIVNAFEYVVAWTGHKQVLRKKMRTASSWDEWRGAALEMDGYLGFDAWKTVSAAFLVRLWRETDDDVRTFTGGGRLAVRLVAVRSTTPLMRLLLGNDTDDRDLLVCCFAGYARSEHRCGLFDSKVISAASSASSRFACDRTLEESKGCACTVRRSTEQRL